MLEYNLKIYEPENHEEYVIIIKHTYEVETGEYETYETALVIKDLYGYEDLLNTLFVKSYDKYGYNNLGVINVAGLDAGYESENKTVEQLLAIIGREVKELQVALNEYKKLDKDYVKILIEGLEKNLKLLKEKTKDLISY